MNDEPPRKGSANSSRFAQAVGIALTGAVMFAASASLAWSLRGWREGAGSKPKPSAGTGDRQSVLLGQGRLAYQVHCARCHGPEGHGDGSDAERLQPPPRDFASGQWRLAPTPQSVRQVIVAGVPGTAMPGWGSSLSRGELEGLVAHVLSLAPRTAANSATTQALVALLGHAGFNAVATPQPAPELAVRDLDGNPSTVAQRQGHPVLVAFWGTSCSHCLTEIPEVIKFADRQRQRPGGLALEVLPVCVDQTDAAVVRDVAGPQLAGQPLYLDPTGTARLHYDVQALPTFVLIDDAGRLVARAMGARFAGNPKSEIRNPKQIGSTKSE